MENKLIIIGASGHGKVVAEIAKKMEKWQQIFFLDDDENIKTALGIDVIGKSDEVNQYMSGYDIFVGIGSNPTREKIQNKLEKLGASIPTLIHPNAVLGEQVNIGKGTAVMAGVIINCCSDIGKGCIINSGATVDHDNVIEDYVHISPGVHLAGTVKVGKGNWLGIGSEVSNNVSIGEGCIIGAGAMVHEDIQTPGTYIGVPAKNMN